MANTTCSDKCGEEQRQAEGGDNRPGRWRRQLDGIFALGMVIVLHGQYRALMK